MTPRLLYASWLRPPRHNKFMEIMHACIPQQTLRKQSKVPWLNSNVVRHIKQRNSAFQAAKRSSKPNAFGKYKKLQKKLLNCCDLQKKNSMVVSIWLTRNSSEKLSNFSVKKQKSIPELHHLGKSAKTSKAKAEMLNAFFGSCFNTSTPPLSTSDATNLVHDCSEDLLCSPSKILGLINTLDAQKASGPDGISVKMLKATATSIAPSIAKLFNISINLARFPQSWKISSIVPIPKSKTQLSAASNYRPISLLSVVSKLLERHLHLLLVDYLKETCPLSNKQWGFQQGKSTTTALLHDVIDQWSKLLERGHEVCAVFFDLRKDLTPSHIDCY